MDGLAGLELIYLKGNYDLIWARMSARQGHYMKPEMLQSQLAALEEPIDSFAVDVSLSLNDMIDKILARYF
jgi:gluconokinase